MQFNEYLGIELAERPRKPRKIGLTMVNDVGWPPLFTEDAFKAYGNLIDILKFTTKMLTFDAGAIQQKVKLCHEYDIIAQPGGMIIEIARAEKKEKETLQKLKEMGFDLIEISASHKLERDMGEELEFANYCRSLGFRTIGEVGKKFSTGDSTRTDERQLDVEETVRQFTLLLEAGVEHVYWEGHLLRRVVGETGDEILARWKDVGPRIKQVVEAVGLDKIFFEVSAHVPYTHRRQQQFWWIQAFGPTVNIGNVRFEEVPLLEDKRRGISPIFGFGDLGDHPWLTSQEKGEGKASDTWWKDMMQA